MKPLHLRDFEVSRDYFEYAQDQEIVEGDLLQTYAHDIAYLEQYISQSTDDEIKEKRCFEAIEALNESWPHMHDIVETFGEVITLSNAPEVHLMDENMSAVILRYDYVQQREIKGISYGFQFAIDPRDNRTRIYHAMMDSTTIDHHEPGYDVSVRQRYLTQPDSGYVLLSSYDEAHEEFDALYELYPEVMEQIDEALDDNDTLYSRLWSLGNLEIPYEVMDDLIQSGFIAKINELLAFSELPVVVSGCKQFTESVVLDSRLCEELKHHDGSNFYARLHEVFCMPVFQPDASQQYATASSIFFVRAKMFFNDRECYGTIPLKQGQMLDLRMQHGARSETES